MYIASKSLPFLWNIVVLAGSLTELAYLHLARLFEDSRSLVFSFRPSLPQYSHVAALSPSQQCGGNGSFGSKSTPLNKDSSFFCSPGSLLSPRHRPIVPLFIFFPTTLAISFWRRLYSEASRELADVASSSSSSKSSPSVFQVSIIERSRACSPDTGLGGDLASN